MVLKRNVTTTSRLRLSVLREHRLFRDLEAEALDQLCQYAVFRKVRRGANIFLKGDPGSCLFAVVSGSVKISTSSSGGRNAILNLITKGEMFGEIALLDGLARTTDATAHTNCELIVIERRDLWPFIQSQPVLSMKFVELLCARLRWTTEQIENVILQDLPGRLASLLIGLTARQGRAMENLPLVITQQEIGEMVGMTRESINKQLRTWMANGWVQLEHGSIAVLDRGELIEIAETGRAAFKVRAQRLGL